MPLFTTKCLLDHVLQVSALPWTTEASTRERW